MTRWLVEDLLGFGSDKAGEKELDWDQILQFGMEKMAWELLEQFQMTR